jgi:hypothetical protein
MTERVIVIPYDPDWPWRFRRERAVLATDLSVDHQGQRVADFFRAYGLDTDGAIPSIIAARLALASRTDSANVRAWSDSCRQWVECNRDKLSTAIATRSDKAMHPTCEDAHG